MRRYYLAAAGLAGLFVAAGSIEFAGTAHSLPLFQHTSAAAFTDAHCLDSGAWQATLTINGTDLNKNPVATISNTQAPLKVGLPYSHPFTMPASAKTFTVSIVVDWNDGVHNDLGTFTADRPDGCTPATTAGTTTTTTCAQAIPPRTDCEVTTSVPPISAPTTSASPTSSSVPASTVASSTSPAVRDASTSIVRPAPIYLPPTGASDWLLLAVAVGGFLILAGLVLTTARRAHDDERGA